LAEQSRAKKAHRRISVRDAPGQEGRGEIILG
jgi:hypothetical protein